MYSDDLKWPGTPRCCWDRGVKSEPPSPEQHSLAGSPPWLLRSSTDHFDPSPRRRQSVKVQDEPAPEPGDSSARHSTPGLELGTHQWLLRECSRHEHVEGELKGRELFPSSPLHSRSGRTTPQAVSPGVACRFAEVHSALGDLEVAMKTVMNSARQHEEADAGQSPPKEPVPEVVWLDTARSCSTAASVESMPPLDAGRSSSASEVVKAPERSRAQSWAEERGLMVEEGRVDDIYRLF